MGKVLFHEKLTCLGMAPLFGAITFAILLTIVLVSTLGSFSVLLSIGFAPFWGIATIVSFLFVHTLVTWVSVDICCDGVYLQAFPQQQSKRKYALDQIRDATVISVDSFNKPLLQFTSPHFYNQFGHQVHGSTESYSFSIIGSHGVMVSLSTGRKLFIGSYYPDRLAAAITQARKDNDGMQ